MTDRGLKAFLCADNEQLFECSLEEIDLSAITSDRGIHISDVSVGAIAVRAYNSSSF